MSREALHRPLQLVTGKGGVGKSVVAAAIALQLAQRGRRVLLFQVNAEDAHSGVLDVAPIGPELREVLPNLFAVNTTPADALREYGLMALRFRAVYNAVFENRLVKYFLRFVPSLGEINMLGKAWFHLAVEHSHDQVFDHVVVDAPATGHGLSFISVARVVADGAVAGPLKAQAEAMAATIEDPERTAVHVVCLPEQMVVEETEELIGALRRRRVAPLGVGVLNRLGPFLFSEGDVAHLRAAMADAAGEALAALQGGEERAQREQAEQAMATQLRAAAPLEWCEIPDFFDPVQRRDRVEEIGGLLFDRAP